MNFVQSIHHGLELSCGSIKQYERVVNVSTIEEDLIPVDTVGHDMFPFKMVHEDVC